MNQISVTGQTYARLVAEAERRGNGVRAHGSVTALVEEALAGDWNASLDVARANHASAQGRVRRAATVGRGT